MKKNGFTLIELTLVLFILALAAHLGTRQLAATRSSRLRAAADRQLEELADAVCRDRAGDVTGFLSDMGRLPHAVPSPDGASLCLAELYVRPEGVGDFRARPASGDNLADEARDAGIADDSVLVPCGWGGPYISLPQGASRLRDPWGNPIENPSGDAGCARLLGEDLVSPAAAGGPVCAVRHLGSDGMADTNRPPASAEARDATRAMSAASAELLLTFEPDTVSRIVWYAPLGDKITGGEVPVDAGESQKLIGDITPGVRFLKVFFSDGAARVIQTTLRPGRGTTLAL